MTTSTVPERAHLAAVRPANRTVPTMDVLTSLSASRYSRRCAPLLVTHGDVTLIPGPVPAVEFTGHWPLRRVRAAIDTLVRAQLISHASVIAGPRSPWGRRYLHTVRVTFGYDVTIVDDGAERTIVCQQLMSEAHAWALGRTMRNAGLVTEVRMLTDTDKPVLIAEHQ